MLLHFNFFYLYYNCVFLFFLLSLFFFFCLKEKKMVWGDESHHTVIHGLGKIYQKSGAGGSVCVGELIKLDSV